jgi:hypothetical protein
MRNNWSERRPRSATFYISICVCIYLEGVEEWRKQPRYGQHRQLADCSRLLYFQTTDEENEQVRAFHPEKT